MSWKSRRRFKSIRLEERFRFHSNIYLQWPFKDYKYFLLHSIIRVFKNTHLSYIYLFIIVYYFRFVAI